MTIKWGMFLHEELMVEYPGTTEGNAEANDDAYFAYEETGIVHTVKQFDKEQTK